MFIYNVYMNDEELYFGGRKFIPTRQAAKMTGYATDYVGQLSRSKKVPSKLIGRVKFIDEQALLLYKSQSDEHRRKVAEERSVEFKKVRKMLTLVSEAGTMKDINAGSHSVGGGNVGTGMSLAPEKKEEAILSPVILDTSADTSVTANLSRANISAYDSFGGVKIVIPPARAGVPKSFTLEEELQLPEDHSLMPYVSHLPSLFFTQMDSSVIRSGVLSFVAGALFLGAYFIAPGIYTKEGIYAVASEVRTTFVSSASEIHASLAMVAEEVYRKGSFAKDIAKNSVLAVVSRSSDKKTLLFSGSQAPVLSELSQEASVAETAPADIFFLNAVNGVPLAYANLFLAYIDSLYALSSVAVNTERMLVLGINRATHTSRLLFAETMRGIPAAYASLARGYIEKANMLSASVAYAEIQYVGAIKILFSSPLALSEDAAQMMSVSGNTLSAAAKNALDAAETSFASTLEHMAKTTYRKISNIANIVKITFKSSREGAFIICAGDTCILRGDIVK